MFRIYDEPYANENGKGNDVATGNGLAGIRI